MARVLARELASLDWRMKGVRQAVTLTVYTRVEDGRRQDDGRVDPVEEGDHDAGDTEHADEHAEKLEREDAHERGDRHHAAVHVAAYRSRAARDVVLEVEAEQVIEECQREPAHGADGDGSEDGLAQFAQRGRRGTGRARRRSAAPAAGRRSAPLWSPGLSMMSFK